MERRATRYRLMLLCGLVVLTVVLTQSNGDTVYLQSGSGRPVALEGVKIKSVEGQNLTFTTAAGVPNTKPLDHIPEIRIDGESVFSGAEEEFAGSDWAAAAEKYHWVIDHNSPDWIKLRSATRLAETAEKTGRADDAVFAFVARTKLWPAADPDHPPKAETIPPARLDSVIAILNQAAADPKLGKEQRVLLLKYLVNLHGFAVKVFSQQLEQLAPPPPPAPKPPEVRHPIPTPASPPTNEPPRGQFEKAIEAARKARDAKIGSAADEFKTAAAEAFRRLNEQRKTEFEIAVASFDFKIREITKTGDLDKALAARGEKEKYIASAKREDELLADEWRAMNASALGGALESINDPSGGADAHPPPPMLLGPLRARFTLIDRYSRNARSSLHGRLA